MTNKILAAIADYTADEHVFNEAVRLAKNKNDAAELLLLHVLPYRSLHTRAVEDALQLRAAQAIALGVDTTPLIDFGNPGEIICRHASAEEWGAKYIVIGHRGRTSWAELTLGSVSAYVTHHAPEGCSVLVVRPPVKILVAMESRAKDEYVFNHAKSLAKQLNASMVLLHILSAQDEKSLMNQEDAGPIILEELALLAHKTTEQDVPTEFDCRPGSVGEEICEYARDWNAKLIVIGSRQYPSLSEKLLGRVSQQVVKNALCSVMVVHPLEAKDVLNTLV